MLESGITNKYPLGISKMPQTSAKDFPTSIERFEWGASVGSLLIWRMEVLLYCIVYYCTHRSVEVSACVFDPACSPLYVERQLGPQVNG